MAAAWPEQKSMIVKGCNHFCTNPIFTVVQIMVGFPCDVGVNMLDNNIVVSEFKL